MEKEGSCYFRNDEKGKRLAGKYSIVEEGAVQMGGSDWPERCQCSPLRKKGKVRQSAIPASPLVCQIRWRKLFLSFKVPDEVYVSRKDAAAQTVIITIF